MQPKSMKKEHFFMHLEAFNCELVRTAKQGYTVWRNKDDRKKMSGVPAGEDLLPMTVCRTCKTLGIDAPLSLVFEKKVIDEIHNNHNSNHE